MFKLSENLIRYRKNQGLTQAEAAEYFGVTKASVSKWETGQTMPDVALLPLIASFYNVTLDELIGYNPLLTREQIQKIYRDYTLRFSTESFPVVYAEIKKKVQYYYSCFPFLLQMSVLLLNHSNLTTGSEDRSELFSYIIKLCFRIEENSSDYNLRDSAHALRMACALQIGSYQEIIDELSDLQLPDRMENKEMLLISAYQATGDLRSANRMSQIIQFKQLISLVQYSTQSLTLIASDPSKLKTTIHRVDTLIETYDLIHLHPNTTAQYYLQSLLLLAGSESKERILSRLDSYMISVRNLFRDNLSIHGDTYFTEISDWFAQSNLGSVSLRSKKEVFRSVCAPFSHPVFQNLGPQMTEELTQKLTQMCSPYLQTDINETINQ